MAEGRRSKGAKKEGETLTKETADKVAGISSVDNVLPIREHMAHSDEAYSDRGTRDAAPGQYFDDEYHAAEERAIREELLMEMGAEELALEMGALEDKFMLSGTPVYSFSGRVSDEMLYNQMSAADGIGIAIVDELGVQEEAVAPEGYDAINGYQERPAGLPQPTGLEGFVLELPPGMEFSAKKEAIENAVQDIAELAEKALAEGDLAAFVNYLDVVDERFHRYSFTNRILMLAQLNASGVDITDPDFDPRLVMGYKAWRESPFKRQVKEGAHAMAIWMPTTKKLPKKDADGNNVLDENNKPIMESRLVGFRVGAVFHAKDTVPLREQDLTTGEYTGPPLGEPLPEKPTLDWPVARGDADELLRRLEAFATSSGYTVQYTENTRERGKADSSGNICVAKVWEGEPMPTAEQALTLAHELAHQHLEHTKWGGARLSGKVKELEAETVAATVCFRSDLKPSYQYLAGWGRKDVRPNILHSLDRISDTALWMLDGVMGVS